VEQGEDLREDDRVVRPAPRRHGIGGTDALTPVPRGFVSQPLRNVLSSPADRAIQ
jgi:hypothetical protein